MLRICAMVLLSAVMPGWQLAGIEGRAWVVWLAAMLEGAAFLSGGGGKLRRSWTTLDCLAGGFLVWNILKLVLEAAGGEDCSGSFLGTAVSLLFFLASWEEASEKSPADSSEKYYQKGSLPRKNYRERVLLRNNCGGGPLDNTPHRRGFPVGCFPKNWDWKGLLLFCTFPVYLGLLWQFFVDSTYGFNLHPLMEESALAPYLLLVGTVALEGYCMEEGGKRWFCFGMALAGWLLLFLDGNVIGILLGCLTFPVSILLHRPEKEFVRRTMQMAFACFFLLSNMPLLVRCFPLIETGGAWSLEEGVCLELALALAGMLFFSWWDRLPEGGGILLHGFQKGLSWALAGTGMVLFLLLVMGERLEGMGDGMGINLLGHFSAAAREYCAGHNGSFYDGIESSGLAGGVWVVCTGLAAVQQMGRRTRRRVTLEKVSKNALKDTPEYLFGRDILGGDILVLTVCLVQAVFFSQQAAAGALYAVAAAKVLYSRRENDSWQSRDTG